jgi:hypothetical protein
MWMRWLRRRWNENQRETRDEHGGVGCEERRGVEGGRWGCERAESTEGEKIVFGRSLTEGRGKSEREKDDRMLGWEAKRTRAK